MENRSRYLPACSAVPQPTTPTRAVLSLVPAVIYAQLGFGIWVRNLRMNPRGNSNHGRGGRSGICQSFSEFLSFPLLTIIPTFLPAHLLWPRKLCGSPVQAAHCHIIVFELKTGYRVRRCRHVMYSYLLTPWSRILPEKLKGFQLVKRYPVFYGTRKFITGFTSASQQFLSWASSIESKHPHPTSLRSSLILSYHLRLGLSSGLFPSGFPTIALITRLLSPYMLHAPHISFAIWLTEQYWVRSTEH